MGYFMLQPQIKYGIKNYCRVEKNFPCKAVIYGGTGCGEIAKVPDGCEEVIFVRGKDGVRKIYPDKTKLWKTDISGCDICGIRLQPGYYPDMEAVEVLEKIFLSQNKDTYLNLFPDYVIKKKPSHPAVHEMLELISESRGRITVEEMAERLSYSMRHINNLFTDAMGFGPKEFERFTRLQYVFKEMIKNPFRNNCEFIEQLDYADQAHFQREFKYFTGMTPRQFIKKYCVQKEPDR